MSVKLSIHKLLWAKKITFISGNHLTIMVDYKKTLSSTPQHNILLLMYIKSQTLNKKVCISNLIIKASQYTVFVTPSCFKSKIVMF